MDFPFGPWEPDKGETSPGKVFDAFGVTPQAEGWGPMSSLTVPMAATALPAQPRGVLALTTAAGSWQVFAGTSTNMYKLQADYTFASVDAGRTVTSGDDWSMTKFGTKLLYTNTTDGLLAYDVEAGGAAVAIAAAKAPRQIFIVANQVVGLDCLDNTGTRNNRLIRASAFSDHTNWTTDGADYQPIEDGGALIGGGALSETAAIVFQERAIRLMDYSSPSGSAYFALKLIASETGSVGARSIAIADGRAFWVSTEGMNMFSLSGGLVPIGTERVNRWFLNTVDQGNLPLMQAAIDPVRKIVWWRMKRVIDSSTTVSEVMIGYAWQLDRWVPPAMEQTSYLCRLATPGYVLDNMDPFGVLDGISTPLDSRFWLGGQPLFAALDESYKFGAFAGSPMAAMIQTATGNSPVHGLINRATPIDDAANGTLSLGVKQQLSDGLTWKDAASKGRGGRVPLRGSGMNIAFKYTIAAGQAWTVAKGVDYVQSAAGGPA